MKYLKYIWLAAAALLLSSCHEDDKAMAHPAGEITAPVLDEHSNITVDEQNLRSEVTFTWSAVDYGYPAAVSYALYAVYGDSEPYQIGESHSTSYTLTKETLNNALVLKKGLAVPEDETSTVFFYITSSISPKNADYIKQSNSIMLSITTIKSTSAPWIRRALWIRGMHNGWSDKDAPVIWETAENSDVYEGVVYLVNPDDPTGDCEFKLCPQNPGWTGNYGGTLAELTTEGNPDNLKTVSGTYYLSVELTPDHKGGVVKLAPVTCVGVIGTAVGGWGDTDDLVLTLKDLPEASDPDYSAKFAAAVIQQVWTGVCENAVDGEFKFRLNNAWSQSWGKTLEHLVYNDPANLSNTLAGRVRFSIDFKGDVTSLLEDTTNPAPYAGKVEQAE